MMIVNAGDFDTEPLVPLLEAVLRKESDDVIWNKVYAVVTETTPPPRPVSSIPQTPWLHHTGSFANSTEYRKYIDVVLKEELGDIYVGIPGFFEAFFGEVAGLVSAAQAVFDKCKEGDNPLYREESGWRGWPEGAKERDVLSWFASLIDQLLDLAEEHQLGFRTPRRPLAQPHQPLQGSTADRRLDVGLVDDPAAGVDSKCRWSQILVPGELNSNPLADTASKAWLDLGRYAREVFAAQDSRRFVLGFTLCGSLMRLWEFDRLGGIASDQFDVNKDGLQFVSAVLGFLWMNEWQLGFDPTIIVAGNKRYIEIKPDTDKERFVIKKVIRRVPCVAGRGTTCWLVHPENDPDTLLVVKDSWQYPEREEEGKLLYEATQKGVVNVARYFHHETVQVGGKADDIRTNVRNGLDTTKATNYKPEKLMPPPSAGRRNSRKGGISAAGRKRSSGCTGEHLPPSKRTCSSSPTKPAPANRVHRRVITRDFGKAIYKAGSRTSLLAALEGCIEGYESLHTQAGLLQRDISPDNLMVNGDEGNPSFPAFLIDLDLAIKEQREKSSGARARTGTLAFMAIGVLLDDENHSFMHDLESFFWVLFWICIHYDGPGKGIKATEFEFWNYESVQKLGIFKKGLIGNERDFLGRITNNFTPYYQPLIPHVNRLRRVVFPRNDRWEKEDRTLYFRMKEILRNAQKDLGKSE